MLGKLVLQKSDIHHLLSARLFMIESLYPGHAFHFHFVTSRSVYFMFFRFISKLDTLRDTVEVTFLSIFQTNFLAASLAASQLQETSY